MGRVPLCVFYFRLLAHALVRLVDRWMDRYSVMRTPCPRLGRPKDVAAAVAFLCSDLASAYVTGVNLMVDGGWTAF